MPKCSFLIMFAKFALGLLLISISGMQSDLLASSFKVGDWNAVKGDDTLIVDERLETPQMYVYHELEDGKPVFQRLGGAKPMALKWVKNKQFFSGILVLLNDSGKQICPYTNGIPDGLWTKYASNGNIEYEIPVKSGYYHGDCKVYETENPGQLWRIGTFTNGYPDGLFVVYSHYANTGEIFESERLTLRTIFNNPSEANRPYLDSDSDSREAVSGIYVGQFYHSNHTPVLEPNNDGYWLDIIGCRNRSLNPLPPAQTILEGEYVKMGVFTGDGSLDSDSISPIKLASKAYWKNGRCLWFEEYGDTPYKSTSVLPQHVLSRRSEYEYFNGYFLETRTTLNISYTDFSADNIYHGSINAQELTFFDTLITTTITYINGQLKHGHVNEFTSEGSSSISGPEFKFSVHYNYSEGEYFLNTKVGEWKYYIVANGEKKLVCVTNYQRLNKPEYSRFIMRQPFKGWCDASYFGDDEVRHGVEKFYRLRDGAFYVGYIYKSGTTISIIKE